MKRALIGLVVVVAALTLILYVSLRHQSADVDGADAASATIEGTRVDVAAQLSAHVLAVHVDEGDHVNRGDLLAELDCRQPRAHLRQAQARVEAAKARMAVAEATVSVAKYTATAADHQHRAARDRARAAHASLKPASLERGFSQRAAKRAQKLHQRAATTDQSLDRSRTSAGEKAGKIAVLDARASAARASAHAVGERAGAARTQVGIAAKRLKAARAELAEARAGVDLAKKSVDDCRVEAPVAGYISTRYVEPGEVVIRAQRVVTVTDISTVKATFFVANAQLDQVGPGAPVRVVADAMATTSFDGRITRVAADAEFIPGNVQTRDDRARLVYAVKVAIGNAERMLHPGMPVEVRLVDPHAEDK